MKANRALFFSVLVLGAALLDAKELQFKAEPLRKGSLVQLSIQSDLRFYTGNLKASTRLMAELFVLEVDGDSVNKVKLAYGDCSAEGTIQGFGVNKSPVENKVYIVERAGNKLSVKNVMGEDVPAEEKAIVEREVEMLGRPNPIAMMLNGQKLNIGDKLGQTDVLRQVIEERLEPYKIGKVKDVEAALISLGEYNKEKTAVFAFRAETGESLAAYDAKFQLNGQLVVAIPSGRPVAIRLDGPVSVLGKEEAAREELRGKAIRGTFSLTVLSQVFPGEEERQHYTTVEEWHVDGGRNRPIRPRPRPTPHK